MSKISRIGIDLSKSVFALYGVDENEQCCLKRTLKRGEVLVFFSNLEPCRVAMESGSGAHYWARELRKLGHDARIIDPKLVAPYRHQGRSGKNDTNDAEAVCEAMSRPSMRFVPVKDVEQQAALVIHRVRIGWVNEQNRVANRLRGLLAEFGVVIPKGLRSLHRQWSRAFVSSNPTRSLIRPGLSSTPCMPDSVSYIRRSWPTTGSSEPTSEQTGGQPGLPKSAASV